MATETSLSFSLLPISTANIEEGAFDAVLHCRSMHAPESRSTRPERLVFGFYHYAFSMAEHFGGDDTQGTRFFDLASNRTIFFQSPIEGEYLAVLEAPSRLRYGGPFLLSLLCEMMRVHEIDPQLPNTPAATTVLPLSAELADSSRRRSLEERVSRILQALAKHYSFPSSPLCSPCVVPGTALAPRVHPRLRAVLLKAFSPGPLTVSPATTPTGNDATQKRVVEVGSMIFVEGQVSYTALPVPLAMRCLFAAACNGFLRPSSTPRAAVFALSQLLAESSPSDNAQSTAQSGFVAKVENRSLFIILVQFNNLCVASVVKQTDTPLVGTTLPMLLEALKSALLTHFEEKGHTSGAYHVLSNEWEPQVTAIESLARLVTRIIPASVPNATPKIWYVLGLGVFADQFCRKVTFAAERGIPNLREPAVLCASSLFNTFRCTAPMIGSTSICIKFGTGIDVFPEGKDSKQQKHNVYLLGRATRRRGNVDRCLGKPPAKRKCGTTKFIFVWCLVSVLEGSPAAVLHSLSQIPAALLSTV